MQRSARTSPRAPQAAPPPWHGCKACGRALERNADERLYCSPRCRALVWRRSRRRAGLGPPARS